MTAVAIPKTPTNTKNMIRVVINDDTDTNTVDISDLNAQFAVPDLQSFGGHLNHRNTDQALVEHLTENY